MEPKLFPLEQADVVHLMRWPWALPIMGPGHYTRLAADSGLAEPPPVGSRLRATLDAAYTGAAACATCHPAETGQWKTTPHASAYATLLSKRRQGVPGCFACHVTGFRQPTDHPR